MSSGPCCDWCSMPFYGERSNQAYQITVLVQDVESDEHPTIYGVFWSSDDLFAKLLSERTRDDLD